jgi:quinol monooxygenase YgiN
MALSKQERVMTKFALYVPLEAKPGKEKEVADFLRSAVPLVNAEVGTVSWFAIQEGPSAFAIFDTFDDEAGRDAHLNGKVAAALMEKARAGDLFAKVIGTVRPRALAVLRLRISSTFVDCWTGRSAGFSPFRIRPVYTPAWRYESIMLPP